MSPRRARHATATRRRVACLIAFVVGAAVRLAAQDGDGGDPWWADRALLPQLALGGDQLAEIETTYTTRRQGLTAATATVTAAAAALDGALSRGPVDVTVGVAAARQLATARAELEGDHLAMLLELRALLTPAQWQRLTELHRQRGGQRGGQRGESGDPSGPRGPEGPAPARPSPPADRPKTTPAGPPPPTNLTPSGTWWRDPALVRALGLATGQQAALEGAFATARPELQAAQSTLVDAQARLGPLLAASTLDLVAARRAGAAVAAARGRLDAAHLEMEVRQLAALDGVQRRILAAASALRPGPASGP